MNKSHYNKSHYIVVLFFAASACSGDSDSRKGPASTTTELIQYNTCRDLENDLKEMLVAEADALIDQTNNPRSGRFGGVEDQTSAPQAGAESDGAKSGRQEGEDFSGTNNQEEGVDEADFVKTDGFHVYVLNGNRLHIFGTPEFGDLNDISSVEIEGLPSQMLINSDAKRVVVFSNVPPHNLPEEHPLREEVGEQADSGWYWRSNWISKATVLDVSAPEKPVLVRELFVEGRHQTARMIDSTVRVASYGWMTVPILDTWGWYGDDRNVDQQRAAARAGIYGMALKDLTPFVYERSPAGEVTRHSITDNDCRGFYRPSFSHARGLTSLFSMDLLAEEFTFDADHVVTNSPTVYASKDRLVIAEPSNDWWWFWWNDSHNEQLNLHVFDIETAGASKYVASGRVDGILHNQFSLDEEDGQIRVATTQNQFARWWSEDPVPPTNHIYVLEQNGGTLETIGHLGDLAKNERIFAARFLGKKAYLVTFEQIDPLFTIDLSDPTEPKVVGELKIPGFSTYLHPMDDETLLSIGVGGDESGANWRTQITMFDVSDFAKPAVFDEEALISEGEWGWSEALYEHKAFQYWAPKGLLAIPLSASRNTFEGQWSYTSTLELISVDKETGLGRHGSIDHSHLFNRDQGRYWYYSDVRRSIFMGDYIYAISDGGISVHETDSLVKVREAQLPGYNPDDHYWWW